MDKANNIELSIIIVSYKSKGHLAVLLPSIFESREIGFSSLHLSSDAVFAESDVHRYTAEVIVVDNDSRDGTREFVSQYKNQTITLNNGRDLRLWLIENVNSGFASGNNIGIKQSSGKYILLLNPDTKVEPDTFKVMLDFMESRPDVGISGCKLIKGNGKLDLACRRRFPNPANSFKRLFLRDNQNYNYTDIDENQSMEVDSVVGAFLLIRRSVMEKIGLLDEKFFMYGEDLDWCFRCKEAGYKVWYYPKTAIWHYKGSSSRKEPFVMLKAFHDSMWIFYKKHYINRYPVFLNWLVFCGIYLRLAGLLFINFFRAEPLVSK